MDHITLEWEKVKVPLYSSYMVSFQALPSPNGRKSIPELDDSSKKRKWEESQTEGILEKRSKPESTKSFFEEIELHRETPLPLEWQRCLDIQVLLYIVCFVCIIIICSYMCVYTNIITLASKYQIKLDSWSFYLVFACSQGRYTSIIQGPIREHQEIQGKPPSHQVLIIIWA
jgi:hypothetical protein